MKLEELSDVDVPQVIHLDGVEVPVVAAALVDYVEESARCSVCLADLHDELFPFSGGRIHFGGFQAHVNAAHGACCDGLFRVRLVGGHSREMVLAVAVSQHSASLPT